MAWNLSGRGLEICSCKTFCPCWLTADVEPDQGWCSAVLVWDSTDLPAFLRASALETLRRYGSADLAEQTKALLKDNDPLVRMAAVPLPYPPHFDRPTSAPEVTLGVLVAI